MCARYRPPTTHRPPQIGTTCFLGLGGSGILRAFTRELCAPRTIKLVSDVAALYGSGAVSGELGGGRLLAGGGHAC